MTNAACKPQTILDRFPEKTALLEAYLNEFEIRGEIDTNRGKLIQSLHKAQGLFGYLPMDLQLFIGKKLRLQQSDVYGVISFYSFFTDKPVGKYKINICTGTACFVKGADRILEEFKNKLDINEGETTTDKKFTLQALRCVGACSLAPVVMVNDKVYGHVTPKMVEKILNDCK